MAQKLRPMRGPLRLSASLILTSVGWAVRVSVSNVLQNEAIAGEVWSG